MIGKFEFFTLALANKQIQKFNFGRILKRQRPEKKKKFSKAQNKKNDYDNKMKTKSIKKPTKRTTT